MIYLARFILKGPSQAALVAASMAILGILLTPAAWVSAAAIALVTLVNDYRQGLVVMALAAVGSMLFAVLLFSSPLVVVYFVLMIWLPVWMAATVLKSTVSLAASLLLVTALSLVAIVVLYVFFPDFGEAWREPLDVLVQQLAQQYQGQMSLQKLKQAEELVIRLIPGLFASSILFVTMISLFLARWWQAAIMNPGGFGKEFQALNLGRAAGLIAVAIVAAAAISGTEPVYAMLFVVVALYLTQGLSILHAVFAQRQLNAVWLYLIYILMFFIPQVVAVLALVGLVDAWIDFRRRLATG